MPFSSPLASAMAYLGVTAPTGATARAESTNATAKSTNAWSEVAGLQQSDCNVVKDVEDLIELSHDKDDMHINNGNLVGSCRTPPGLEADVGTDIKISTDTAQQSGSHNSTAIGCASVRLCSGWEDYFSRSPPRKRVRLDNVSNETLEWQRKEGVWGPPGLKYKAPEEIPDRVPTNRLNIATETKNVAIEVTKDRAGVEWLVPDALPSYTAENLTTPVGHDQHNTPKRSAHSMEPQKQDGTSPSNRLSTEGGAVQNATDPPKCASLRETNAVELVASSRPVPISIEVIQTEYGPKKRKLLGPFVLEDVEDSEIEEGLVATTTKVDRKHSPRSHCLRNSAQSNNSTLVNDSSSSSRSQLAFLASNRTTFDESELSLRRKQAENRCASLSRVLREQAIARVEAHRLSGFQDGLEGVFREEVIELSGDSTIPSPSASSSSSCKITATNYSTKDSRADSLNGRVAKAERMIELSSDEDDVSGLRIEKQLDVAQAISQAVNRGESNVLSGNDSRRWSRPLGQSTSEQQMVNDGVHPQARGNHRSFPHYDLAPPQRKQLANVRSRDATILHDEGRGGEQPNCILKRDSTTEPSRTTTNSARVHFVPASRPSAPTSHDSTLFRVSHEPSKRNEARLLAAKGSLKIAPNVYGGLAKLALMAEAKNAKAQNHGDLSFRQDRSAPTHSGPTLLPFQGIGAKPVDARYWASEGTPKQRKKDVEHIMGALKETAKCWLLVLKGHRNQKLQVRMESHLRELLEDYAVPIFQGYISRPGHIKRVLAVKNTMSSRASRFEMNNPFEHEPTEIDVEEKLVGLIGQSMFHRGKTLLSKVLAEHEQKRYPYINDEFKSSDTNIAVDVQRTTRLTPPYGNRRTAGLDPLDEKTQADWNQNDAEAAEIRKKLAGFESLSGQNRCRAAGKSIGDNFQRTQYLDETVDGCATLTSGSHGGSRGPARPSQGGKGILSEIRKQLPGPAGSRSKEDTKEVDEDIEEEDRSDRDAEDLLVDNDVVDDMYSEKYFTQYNVLADYDNFDDYEDASSVFLGRHLDIQAALRQLRKVTCDVSAWASKRYRKVRIIWDTDDYELVTQTVVLPTNGECRVYLVRSWESATEWPGRLRDRGDITPKVFYVVHETETISTRPTAGLRQEDSGVDGGGKSVVEGDDPADFDDPGARQVKECDMYFSNRRCANEVARNRWIARHQRQRAQSSTAGKKEKRQKKNNNIIIDGDDAENDDDDDEENDDSNDYNDEKDIQTAHFKASIAGYMEQIEHDEACFDRRCRFWIYTNNDAVDYDNDDDGDDADGSRATGKTETRIWVEAMIADSPYT
jgi:hypothetical protein